MAVLSYGKNAGIRFVKDMGVGWNLGNALDTYKVYNDTFSAAGYETYWDNPVTTPEIIQCVSDAGFKTIRIPVSWGEHMDESGVVDREWMARVKEVVDDVISRDMYAVLNTHHEEWLSTSAASSKDIENKLTVLWEQIADTFKEYDNKLVFEGVNEPRARDTEYEWVGRPQDMETVNRWNKLFVDTIRKAGSSNMSRYLMITTYAGNVDEEAINSLEIPEDNNIIVTMHLYKPYNFTMDMEETAEWSGHNSADTEELTEIFARLDKNFTDKKIPVVIGEFACVDKDNIQARAEWTEYCMREMKKRNMGAVWWDDGGTGETGYHYALLDRYNCKWIYPLIVEKLTMVY